jgi:hypothetical protein
MDIERVVAELEACDNVLPRKALEIAMAHRDLVTPHLLEILKKTVEDPSAVRVSYMGHLYAMYLLAAFREKEAYPLIADLALLPENLLDSLLDDVVTDDLGRSLASVSCGDDALIRSLVENKSANEWARAAGVQALVALVACGEKTRNEVIDYFRGLYRGKLEREYSAVWDALISHSMDLHPAELFEDMRQAREDDLFDPDLAQWGEVSECLERGMEANLRTLKDDPFLSLITDPVAELETWACFRPTEALNPEVECGEAPDPRSYAEEKEPTPPPMWEPMEPVRREKPNIGRNEPCPCGSGKKYKKCCGKPAS